MRRSAQDVWIHRFAWMLAVATLFLVALGGVVTTKGVGMAVPDWPTTYGDHMFFFPYSKWVGGVFYEHSHRLWGSIVGLLTSALLIWVWIRDTKGGERAIGIVGVVLALGLMGIRTPGFFIAFALISFVVLIYALARWFRERRTSGDGSLRWLLVAAFAAVIIQGVLGGLRVTMDLHGWGTEFGIMHGALAQLFFLLVGTITVLTSGWWSRALPRERGFSVLHRVILATTLVIFLQLILGASMRHQHAGLAVPDFPLAYGKLWPQTDSASIALYNQQRIEMGGENPITASHVVLHMLHRATAFAITLLVLVSAILTFRRTNAGSPLRKFAVAWMCLIVAQVTLGAFTVWSQRKVDVTTAHVAVGALTFLVGWLSLLIASRRGVETAPYRASAELITGKGAELKHA